MQTKIIYISENRNLSIVRDELLKAHLLGCDTETTSLDCLVGKIRLLQLATVDKTFVLDCFKLSKSAILEYIIEPILYNPDIVKIFHNAKFDLSFVVTNFDADLSRIAKIYDTYIIAKLCLGGSFYQASLGNLAQDFLDVELDKTNQLYNWAGNIYKEQIVYSALDAAVLIPLYHVLNKAVNANCLQKTALLELETIPAITQLELNGILLDRDMWLDIAESGREELYKIEKELENYFGRINFKSSAQVSKELSTLTGLNINSVAKGALEGLIDNYEPRPGLFDDRDYRPAVLKLMEHRREQKRYDAFGPAFLNHIHPKTGRIHPSVKQIDTRTGRPSCTNPNMFQIPRDSAMRKCFIAPPGKKIITKDYSQIELRLLAQFSGDAGLRKAFEDGLDLHTATAAEMFNVPLEKVRPEQRQFAKTISFGVPYGMGPNKLATTLKIEKSKAQGLLKKYYATYPGLEVWFEQQRQYLMSNNCVRTASGRLKDVSDWRVDPDKEFKAQQSSKNMPIQGSSADIIKTAISRMYRELPHDCLLVNTVYDEVVFEVPEECAVEYDQDIERIMLDSAKTWMPDVSVTVSTSIADSWSK